MSRPSLEEVIGAPPRDIGELPPAMTLPDSKLITMVLLNVDEAKLVTLQELGYIESYVLCPQMEDNGTGGRQQRFTAQGDPLRYVSVLLTESQLEALREVNRSYRVVETAQLVAATREQLPDIAKAAGGGPAHVFLGVPFGTES